MRRLALLLLEAVKFTRVGSDSGSASAFRRYKSPWQGVAFFYPAQWVDSLKHQLACVAAVVETDAPTAGMVFASIVATTAALHDVGF